MTKQIIIPHLWYDKEAKEAAEFYVSAFGQNSKIKDVTTIHDTPSGSADIVSFDILGQEFMAISAGPLFKFNPSISFHVKCKTKEEVDEIWQKLSPGGTVMMELGEYPFSQRYGWIQDKYGVVWQVISEDWADFMEKNERVRQRFMLTKDIMRRGGKGGEEIAENSYSRRKPHGLWTLRKPEERLDNKGRGDELINLGQELTDSLMDSAGKENDDGSLSTNC